MRLSFLGLEFGNMKGRATRVFERWRANSVGGVSRCYVAEFEIEDSRNSREFVNCFDE